MGYVVVRRHSEKSRCHQNQKEDGVRMRKGVRYEMKRTKERRLQCLEGMVVTRTMRRVDVATGDGNGNGHGYGRPEG